MRVILDTNVLISAFVFPGGTPESVFRMAVERSIQLVTSPTLLAEFARVLGSKFGWADELVDNAVQLIARISLVVTPTKRVHVVKDDPDDDRVLEAAAAAEANVIVSGDRHLLRLKSWSGIPIMTASAFFVDRPA